VGDSVEPGEIFLYEIATGVTVQLTNNALDDHSPRINDRSVVWVRADVTGATSLFIHHIGNGTEPAPDGFVWEDTPQKDGDVKVLTRYDGNDREIFTLNLDLGVYDQITNNNFEDRSPVISRGIIAWLGKQGQASEIYTTGAAPSVDCEEFVDVEGESDGRASGADDSTGEGGGGGFCFIGTIGKGFSW
jgi:hypothetical protein